MPPGSGPQTFPTSKDSEGSLLAPSIIRDEAASGETLIEFEMTKLIDF